MKMLTVYLLVCAMVALTRAADVPTGEPDLNSDDNSSNAEEVRFCPDRWTRYNDRCFLFIDSLMDWADAEVHCQTVGGNLASVHGFDEQSAIQSMIQRESKGFPETWLGGQDATKEGTWLWSDGTLFSYTYWAPGQPDNFHNEDCLVMNYGDEKKFNDRPCNYLRVFACGKNV